MKEARWVKCNGEAHSNGFIDHCMVCLPWWEDIPTCPECWENDNQYVKLKANKSMSCPRCRKRHIKQRYPGDTGDIRGS